MQELQIEAKKENLEKIQNYIFNFMSANHISEPNKMKVDVIVEEIFVNICNYAYDGKSGPCIVRQSVENNILKISFIDNGKKYNPLEEKDPDITLGIDLRPIGGLGIYMTKKFMDEVLYEYKDNQNILTIIKDNNKKGN